MASALLCRVLVHARAYTLGVALAGSGCFLPQEDTILEPITQPNHPPVILENTALPSGHTIIGVDRCNNIEFTAHVEDRDLDDLVISRWYIDYGPGAEGSALVAEETLTNTGEATRLPAPRLPAQGQPRLVVAGPHEVTLMVFDGNLGAFEGPGSVPRDQVPDSGVNRYSVTHTWIVETDPSHVCTGTVP